MLFVVVLEFFICWTPLYIINTIAMFEPRVIYQEMGYTAISFLQLLAYSSSCCNPITYCFMSHGFRKAFVNLFRCFRQNHQPKRRVSLGYAPQSNATLHLHPFNHENDNLNNKQVSENLDLSCQNTYRINKDAQGQSDESNDENVISKDRIH